MVGVGVDGAARVIRDEGVMTPVVEQFGLAPMMRVRRTTSRWPSPSAHSTTSASPPTV